MIPHSPGSRFLAAVLLGVFISSATATGQDESADKNSTRKIRVTPSSQSSRIGAAVDWQPDFESAMTKARETGKPIFWYVPTLRGTFMDRKNEIDRYMLAGPFSWPDIVAVINEHYIAVRQPPTRQQQDAYGLVPYKFVEPGFLVLELKNDGAPDGSGLEVKMNVDRITTTHPQWFRGMLTKDILQPIEAKSKPQALAKGWELFRSRDFESTVKHLVESKSVIETYPDRSRCECELLKGMAVFRTGKHAAAKTIWQQASLAYENEPLAWKSAAEAQMIGPFTRGFEVFGPLSERALTSGTNSIGSQAPGQTYSQTQLWQNGMQFLLGMQNEQGGFTDCDYDFGGTDSLPNVHVAVTSLAGMAMLKACERRDIQPEMRNQLVNAIDQAIAFVSNDANVNKIDRDEILWAYAYRLRFLCRCHQQAATPLKTSKSDLKTAIATATRTLENVQSRQGSWYHEYNNPFVTATALTALHEAKQSGADLEFSKIEQGVGALSSDRFANGAYPYSSSRRPPNQKPGGTARDVAASAGRMPICELGLWYWDQSSDEALASAIRRSLDLQENLDIALKYDDHTSRLAYGGFFFWYDMRGRSEAISRVKNPETQTQFKAEQKAIIMALPEIDGCFVDSHELGRVYGTSMALLSLSYCQ